MAVTEQARHDFFNQVREVMGPESAATLMELLPPVGWADVATKHDVAELEKRLGLRFAAIDHRFEELEQRLDLRFDKLAATFRGELFERSDHQTKVFVGWLLGGIGVILGTMVGAMALLV